MGLGRSTVSVSIQSFILSLRLTNEGIWVRVWGFPAAGLNVILCGWRSSLYEVSLALWKLKMPDTDFPVVPGR